MDFSIKERKKLYKSFIQNLEKEMSLDVDYTRKLENTKDCNYITVGIEGKVFKCTIKRHSFDYIIKLINLRRLRNTKGVYKLFKRSQSKLYSYFLTKNIFNKPTFTELISFTLTNRLVFQKICPHFVLNYYWDFSKCKKYKSCILKEYNEYINCCTLTQFFRKSSYDQDTCSNILFQIMVGLYSLKKYYGMLHTDLHLDNVLVQTVKPGGYWKYIIDGKKYYLPNLGFQILLNDFGFAWIPKKLYIKWHLDRTLKYITKIGLEFYDLAKMLRFIYLNKVLKVSQPEFVKLIKQNFISSELNYVLSREYYQNENSDIVNNYPDISKRYYGNNMSLSKKIYNVFYKKYSTVYGNIIDTFSLDKKINKQKLPENFRKLVML